MNKANPAHGGTSRLRRMAEATQLTRAGRLHEATALIQRTLRGGDGGSSPSPRRPRWVDSILVHTADRQADGRAGAPAAPPLATTATRTSTRTRGDRFVSESWTGRAGTRAYKVYVPGGATETAMPLIVMLHGCTQGADDFAVGTRMNELAERQGFIVVYPEQSRQANPSGCWNWFKPGDQQRDGGEPSIIADIARRVAATAHVDRRQIFVAGMSAGGAMAMIMAATHPDLFAAVGVHSGIAYGVADDLPSAFRVMRNGGELPTLTGPHVPTIVFHGDRDQTVHQRNGEQVLAQAISGVARPLLTVHDGTAITGRGHTRYVYRDPTSRVLAEGWSVQGLGHAWSGGDPAGSYTDADGPDASAEMRRFFAEHGRGG